MSYVRLTEPYTRFCNLFKNFQSSGYSSKIVLNHIIPCINGGLLMTHSFWTGHLNFILILHFSFWLPGQPGPHKKSTSWTRPCIWFRPTKPTPTLQEWPQKQKQPSMMSATICACIKDLLSLSTATTSFSL